MAISPQLGALLARLLADVGTSFAEEGSGQQRLGLALSDKIGGLVRAQAFNQSQQLSQNIGTALREPGVGPGLPATAANVQAGGALVAPGISPGVTTAAGTVTPQAAGAPGVAPPQQIDPFQALALGQEGTQDLIRTQQQDKFLVQRGLDRQQDFANRLKLIQQTRKNQQELRDLQNQFEAERDIERGGPEQRADEAFLRGIDVRSALRQEEGAPTVEQLRAGTESDVASGRARALTDILEFEATPDRIRAEQAKAEREGLLSPAELSTSRDLAERGLAPAILNTLTKRLGKTKELDEIRTTLNDPTSLSDEISRRKVFISMMNLLTPNEKADLNQQFGISLDEIGAGRDPFRAIGLGAILGTRLAQPLQGIEPPSATNPAIDPIGTASLADAVAGARDPNSLLRRSGR